MHNVIVRSERRDQIRRLAERGLTTVEYAIGLLAAATVAILLLRIFADNEFFRALQEWVLNVFSSVLSGGFSLGDLFSMVFK